MGFTEFSGMGVDSTVFSWQLTSGGLHVFPAGVVALAVCNGGSQFPWIADRWRQHSIDHSQHKCRTFRGTQRSTSAVGRDFYGWAGH